MNTLYKYSEYGRYQIGNTLYKYTEYGRYQTGLIWLRILSEIYFKMPKAKLKD